MVITLMCIYLLVRSSCRPHRQVNVKGRVDLHVFVEDKDCSYDFTVRLGENDTSSMDVLLEAISCAAMEAAQLSFDTGHVHVQRLDAHGRTVDVLTDEDCGQLHAANALRIFTSESLYRRGLRSSTWGRTQSARGHQGTEASDRRVLLEADADYDGEVVI